MKSGKQPTKQMLAVIRSAEQRMAAAWDWSIDCPTPFEMIKTRDAVILGLKDQVRVVAANDGREVWRTEIDGAVHGLAVANGWLFISTDAGHIHAFASPDVRGEQ